ncbi:MAG: hypothetical protein IJS20_00805 [Bacteroidales bacterium]|nr:hypothetical protein [Bacteroidales bacterium]
MNENTIEELRAWQDDARHELTRELDRLDEKRAQIESSMKALDATDELLAEIDNLNRKVEHLNEECDIARRLLQEEKERSQTLEMRLSELTKLSAGVAKKSSQDELLKALRTFVNKSKQKRIEKRAAIKEMVLELVIANGITLPDDLATSVAALDDEEPKPMNVSGDYVVNKNVKYEVDNVATGSTGIAVNE